MDNDLRDAVLAAFDEDPGKKPASAEAAAKGGEGAGAEAGGSEEEAGALKGDAAKRARLARAAAEVRRRGGGSGSGKGGSSGAARAADGSVSAGHGGAVSGGSRDTHGGGPARWSLRLVLVLQSLTIVLLLFLVIRTGVQLGHLRQDMETRLGSIESGIAETRELAKFGKIKLGVYAEQGKRPQAAIVVLDEQDGGRLRLGRTVIRPLEEAE